MTKSTSVHGRLDASILGWLWGGEWQSIGCFVFPVALKQVKANTWWAHLFPNRLFPQCRVRERGGLTGSLMF